MPSLLALDRLGVEYRDRDRRVAALSGVTLELASGRRLAVIGESGSGKSTLALAIAGLLPHHATVSGSVEFPAMATPPRLGRDIGVLFQDPAGSLDPVMRVGDQIAEAIVVNRHTSWEAARKLAVEWLERVRLPQARESFYGYPHEFSGGQKQRIALAAALAPEPALLIADEPTSALDTVTQRGIVALLDSLVAERRLTLVFVTHDIALASGLANEVAVLRGGRLMEAGPAERLFSAPAHPYTRALLAMHLDLEGPRPERLPEIAPEDLAVDATEQPG